MADIKQAAKWMQEGKKVRREESMDGCAYMLSKHSIRVVFDSEHTAIFFNDDLLADDWEVVP
jgi:urease gamma subunit